jgi:transposase
LTTIEASAPRIALDQVGNRQLNCELHVIAVCQIRDPGPGQVYCQRKLAEAKTPEARRSLKRHLSNVVYQHLIADRRHPTPAT